jgi:dTDP-4-dehydrorhamnose reductase
MGYDVVVNAAAWTAVDAAEAQEPAAFAVNAVGARNVALAAREAGARMVQISTDYVFDGSATTPYAADHPQAPCSAYGRTKAAGEWAVRLADPNSMVVRTAWLYGNHGPSFVKTMLRLARERETISVVEDQTGQPTWTRDLCEFIVALINTELPGGFYHGTNEGEVTRYDLARAIFTLADLDPERVNPCTTTDFPIQAPRPAYSVLDHAAGDPAMPTWHDALQRYLSIP